MTKIERWYQTAYGQHQAGDLTAAEAGYRRILEIDPRHVRALYLLGSLHAQRGEHTLALPLLDRALALHPDFAEAHNNRGIALKALGRSEEALDAYAKALGLRADYAEAHNNRGIALRDLGQPEEALADFERAVTLRPSYAEPHNNRGISLKDLGRLEEAEHAFRQAIAAKSDYAEPYNNLGLVLTIQGRFAEAVACHDHALALQPNHAQGHNMRGAALKELHRYEEARASYQRALTLDPACVDAVSNLGSCLLAEGQLDAAIECYALALQMQPGHLSTLWNRSLGLMLQGNWDEGWREYEVRFDNHKVATHTSSKPRWDGSPLNGRTILVHAEQGFGDTLNFVRYLPFVKARGGRVRFECQPALQELLAGCAGIDELVSPPAPGASPSDDHDVQIPLLSLPGLFGTTPETTPADVPYVAVPAERAGFWRERLAEITGALPASLKVGLVWAGSPTHKNDHNRSCALADFAPLARVPGVTFFSLQKGPSAAQAQDAPAGMTLVDLGPALTSFADTAAVLSEMDLIIAVDTSVVHLAGALGKPVWTLLPFSPDWRWMRDREDTPWYPTMRLLRQTQPGDWAPVIERAAAELARLAGHDAAPARSPADTARHLDAQGEHSKAAIWWQTALQAAPRDPALWEGLGRCCLALGEAEAARESLTQALRLNPARDSVRALLGELDGEDKNEEAPAVSVIIPCYKQAHLLPEAVESVVAQTFPDWEIVIVNDGSPDNTSEAARALIAHHPDRRIRLIEQANAGLPAARNAGLRAADGEYILPLDADDALHPEMLAATVGALRAAPEASVAYTHVQHFGTRDDAWASGPFTLESQLVDNRLPYCSLMRRAFVEALDGWNQDAVAYEDWDFWLRTLARDFRGVLVPRPLFRYRASADSKLQTDNRRRDYFVACLVLRHRDLYGPARVATAEATIRRAEEEEACLAAALESVAAPHTGERPRALFVVEFFHPQVGGCERLVEDVAGHLMEAGWEAEVVTSPLPERTEDFHRGIRVHSVTGDVRTFLPSLARARRFDCVLVFTGPESPYMAAVAALPPDGPRVVNVPCINADGYRYVHQAPAIRQTLAGALGRAQAVACSSRHGLDARLLEEMGVPSVYVPNAVHAAVPAGGGFRARHGIPHGKPLLLCVGNLWPVKDHAGLLQRLWDHAGDWHLAIIGAPARPWPHLGEHIRRLATLDGRVTLIPGAPAAEVAAAMAEADLFLLPSLADATPLVLLEAMSHQLPWVATTACASAPEHAGGLVLPLERFPAAIAALLRDEESRRLLGEAGHEHWQTCYSWDAVGPRYVALAEGADALPALDAPEEALQRTHSLRERFNLETTPPPAETDGGRPAVSVVVCTHNRVDLLRRVLKSYETQTLPQWAYEVIVVDDGSTDGTARFLNAYQPGYRLVVHRQPENRGLSAARNQGILRARGEVILFQDDDDAATPAYLEQHLRTHQANPGQNVGVFGRIDLGREVEGSVTFQVLCGGPGLYNHFDDLEDGQILDFRHFWMNVVSVKTSLLRQFGFFDEETRWGLDDAELGWRLKDCGLRLVHNKAAVLHALRSLTLEQFCRRQAGQGRAAAWMTRKHTDPAIPFWLGVSDAEQRLSGLEEAWGRAQGIVETLDSLERIGWAAVSALPDFQRETFPALISLCRIASQYYFLAGYLERLREEHAQDEAEPTLIADGPLVSVVVTCYNYGRYLAEAVESVVAQTYANWEMIIVNDGSPDNTREVAEALVAAHPERRIRLIDQPNSGHAAHARNRGLAEAKGQYLLCLDADDILEPTFLAESVSLLERNPRLSIAYTDQIRFYEDGLIERFHAGDYSVHALTQYLPLGACSLFRRQAWRDAGPYRPVGYEDWDFWLACAETGHQGRRIPKPLFRYRKHNEGKYAQDLAQGVVHKARLALSHPALFNEEARRWAMGVIAEHESRATEDLNARIADAEALFAAGNAAQAKARLSALAQAAPDNTRVLNDLGVLCWQEGDAAGALRWFVQALQADPQDQTTALNCADVMEALGQHEDARALRASLNAPARLAA